MTPAEKVSNAIRKFEEAKAGLISAMDGVDAVRGRRMSPPRTGRHSDDAQPQERLDDWKAARAVLETALAHLKVAQSLLDFMRIRQVEPPLEEQPERPRPITLN